MPLFEADLRDAVEPLDSQLLRSIQVRVDSKLGKTYDGCNKLIICVYVHALICSEAEVQSVLERVSLTVGKPATSVYAYCLKGDVAIKGYLTKKLL